MAWPRYDGRRVRPLVVVDQEHDRQAADAGEVHPLVRVAAGGRPVAAPRERDPALLADAEGERHADRHGEHGGQVADHRVQPEPGVAEVDVAVAAVRRPVVAAHVLREDPPRLDAARDVHAHVALQRAADVVGAHGRADSDGGRLVAAAGVEGARDLPLLVEDVAALLDPARREHVPVEAEQVLAVQPDLLHFLEGAERLRFPYCHWHPLGTIVASLYPVRSEATRPARRMGSRECACPSHHSGRLMPSRPASQRAVSIAASSSTPVS